MRIAPAHILRATALAAAVMAAQCFALGQTAAALSNFESSVEDYNLVSLNNVTLDNVGDTQGGLAVGGSLTVTSTTYVATGPQAVLPSSSNPTLYVAGGLTLDGNTLGINAGYAALPGLSSSNWTWGATQKQLVESGNGGTFSQSNGSGTNSGNNPIGNPIPANWNWSTIGSNLSADSTNLYNAAVNGTISVSSGNLLFTPNSTPAAGSTVVFSITGAQLNSLSFSNVSINVPADVNYVINVVNAQGMTLFGSGENFNSGSNNGQILWNFYNTSGTGGTVTLGSGSGSFYGSILSPTMAVNTNLTVNGQVAASSFSDSGAELHFESFDAVAVVVPEPLTFALWGVGLCGAAVVIRRRLMD